MYLRNFPVWVVFALAAGYFVFKIIRRGGFKAAIFNAEIGRTVGEVQPLGFLLGGQRIKVHLLRKEGQGLVGLEVVSKTVGSYNMVPVTLTPETARALANLLQEAARSSQ